MHGVVGDRVDVGSRLEGGVEDEEVSAGSARERVVAQSANEGVVAYSPVEGVVAQSTVEKIVALLAEELSLPAAPSMRSLPVAPSMASLKRVPTQSSLKGGPDQIYRRGARIEDWARTEFPDTSGAPGVLPGIGPADHKPAVGQRCDGRSRLVSQCVRRVGDELAARKRSIVVEDNPRICDPEPSVLEAEAPSVQTTTN